MSIKRVVFTFDERSYKTIEDGQIPQPIEHIDHTAKKRKRSPSACSVCGSEEEHKPVPTLKLQNEPLSAQDWLEVFHFIKFVYLPFLHGIVSRARMRAKNVNS